MIKHYFTEYKQLGMTVIPVEWNEIKKQPVSHRQWSTPEDLYLRPTDNAIMVLTGAGYGCLDFDLKNTKDKGIFDRWMDILTNEHPDLLNNLFIEQTRNAGYHVWFRYGKLPKKTALAESPEGNEVIALYCNGPLVYTYPTPGYKEFHNSMQDLTEISEEDYHYLIGISQFFNQYKPDYDPTKKAVNYPSGMEEQLANYDNTISDEGFESILALIGLEPCDYAYKAKDKFIAYKRRGSISDGISAKVYPQARRVLIFSASMHRFPNWHTKESYPVWSLPPSFLLFYHYNRDWEQVYKHIGVVNKKSESSYPFNIYPQVIVDSIHEVASEKSLNPEFLATAGLWTVASLVGNCYSSELAEDVKNIIFAIMIAPVSVGKTPAFKAMCEGPLKDLLTKEDKEYEDAVKNWNLERADANSRKEPFNKAHPKRFHPFAVDGTTEGYVALMQDQEGGMGVYHDEAETILNAGAHKSNNDAISFFTQAFSGGRYTQIRADRSKERVVKSLNISLLMGTQPSRLKNLFGSEQIQSGFASRFLMVKSDHIQLEEDVDPFAPQRKMCSEWSDLLFELYKQNKAYCRGESSVRPITITDEAKPVMRSYFRQQRKDGNVRRNNGVEEYVMGTEAKMSAYYFRFCHLIAIMNNPMVPLITTKVAEQAWQLYRWYADSTIAILGSIYEENESGLPADLRLLVDSLPSKFTAKEAEETCLRLNIKPMRFKNAMRRKDFQALFKRIAHGSYEKM